MAFIVGAVIGTVGAIAGGAIAAKGSKDAASTAAAGSEREIKYLEESRDIARGDQAPYREAGYQALDKLGGMTGLLGEGESFGTGSDVGGTGQGQALTASGSPWGESPWSLSWDDGYVATLDDGTTQYWNDSSQSWQSSRGSAYGGGGGGGRGSGAAIQQRAGGGPLYPPTVGRAVGGQLYNVNELGPESVYSQGSYTRNSNPQTLPQDPTGYVKPTGLAEGGYSSGVRRLEQSRIAGRAIGGSMAPQVHMDFGNLTPAPNTGTRYDPTNDPAVGRGAPQRVTNGGVFPDAAVGTQFGNDFRDIYGRSGGKGGAPGPQIGAGGSGGGTVDLAGESTTTYGQPIDDGGRPIPQENPYDFETDPGYNFRFNEGQRMLERGAAARGGLLSGGFARKAIRYGQDYATNEFSNIYNRISNIAGLGQVSAQSGGNQAIAAGGAMGRAGSEGALSSAYGDMGATNAWANAANQVAQLPWGSVFNQPKTTGAGNPSGGYQQY